jgi:hypothetical protein
MEDVRRLLHITLYKSSRLSVSTYDLFAWVGLALFAWSLFNVVNALLGVVAKTLSKPDVKKYGKYAVVTGATDVSFLVSVICHSVLCAA